MENSKQNSLQGAELPENWLQFGTSQPGDVQVYIHQDVYKALEAYSLEDVTNERGTILLGDWSQTEDGICVVISEYVEARYTEASAATLTFTHKTWEYVNSVREKDYPDLRIVGWQHTHPGYGVFLSNYDLFIQQNFFNLPFQVAYVIDPVQDQRGFFQWLDGKICPVPAYRIYDRARRPIKIPKRRPQKQTGKSDGLWKGLTVLAIVLALVAVLISGIQAVQLTNARERIRNLERLLGSTASSASAWLPGQQPAGQDFPEYAQ